MKPLTEADVKAIKKVLEQVAAAIDGEDVNGFAAMFTEDAVMMPPNHPAVIGKESIQSWFQDFVDKFTVELKASSEEINVSGDWAIVRLSFTSMASPLAGGEAVPDKGKGIHIYKRQPDGSWKIHRDIWNSDNPPHGTQ